MRIKNMTKYIAKQTIKVYGIYAGIILLCLIICEIFKAGSIGSFSGTEAGSILCLMITMLTFYRENISMSCQNGMSRKSYIISNGAAVPITAGVAAIGDTLLSVIGNFFEAHGGAHFNSFYEELFKVLELRRGNYTPTSGEYIYTLVFYFCSFLIIVSGGLLIASIIYRLPKALKVAVPVGFYALIFIVFPIITAVVASSDQNKKYWIVRTTVNIMKFIDWLYKSVWRVSAAFIIISAVMFIISSLVIRRTPITDKKS